MIFKKIYIFAFFGLMTFNVFSQQKAYWFLIPKNPYRDTIRGMKFHAEYEFSYTRIYIKDSCFQEKGIWWRDSDTETSEVFKIKNGNWFIKIKGRWRKIQPKKYRS